MKNILYALALIFLLSGCHSPKEENADLKSVISVEKMNVLYVGIDNPIAVSVSGVPSSKISVKMDDGKITGSNGEYIVNIGSPGEAKIDVFAEMDNGEKKPAGTFTFRVKRVPDPVSYFANKKGDDIISKTELEKADKVQARMDNFDFDLHFDVISFEIVASLNGLTKVLSSNSSSLTEEQKQLLSQVPSGAHIIIQNVKAKGSDGSERGITGLNLTVL